ncbi:MAG: hypothetical protein LC104_20690 [Bacteroidales bacterium]|nr:hypothetical protein [Bacteroidales bacterium]
MNPNLGHPPPDDRPPLEAYLLGTLTLAELLALQARLAYEVSGDANAAVILCDLPAGITIGRHGSRAHLRWPAHEYETRGWPICWVGRGGGCLLHLPGQVVCYPVLPLSRLGLTPGEYTQQLTATVADVIQEFGLHPQTHPERPGVWVAGRQIAQIGIAIRNWVTTFGVVINVNPDLALFRAVCCEGDTAPMTSLLREAAHPVRLPAVRQRFVERLAERFHFGRVSVFHHHPSLTPNIGSHAIAFRH